MKKTSLAFLSFFPLSAYAQFRNEQSITQITSPLSPIGDIVLWICALAILVALFRLVAMALWYLTGEGDEGRTEKAAQTAIFHGIILILAVLLFAGVFIFRG